MGLLVSWDFVKEPLGFPVVPERGGGMVDWCSQSGWAASLLGDLGELAHPLWFHFPNLVSISV